MSGLDISCYSFSERYDFTQMTLFLLNGLLAGQAHLRGQKARLVSLGNRVVPGSLLPPGGLARQGEEEWIATTTTPALTCKMAVAHHHVDPTSRFPTAKALIPEWLTTRPAPLPRVDPTTGIVCLPTAGHTVALCPALHLQVDHALAHGAGPGHAQGHHLATTDAKCASEEGVCQSLNQLLFVMFEFQRTS